MTLAADRAASSFVNLDELEAQAQAVLPASTYDFFAGGAETESAVRGNREAFGNYRFAFKVLGGTMPDPSVELFGETVSLPVLLAPTGMQRLAHEDGELASARAAAVARTIYCASTLATTSLEDIAATSPATKWFQLYVYPDRGFTAELIDRAMAAGYRAIVMTVDTPVLGRRERDERNGFALPAGMSYANLPPQTQLGLGSSLRTDAGYLIDPAITWETVEWLLGRVQVPVLLKGVVRGDDTVRAAELGVSGVIVSNHGGRQLDHSVATLDALPAVIEAASGMTVLLDGGVRRGTDVLKALCLGAKAVLIGRPYLWGLAVGGEDGVVGVIDYLRAGIIRDMALLGAACIGDLGPQILVPAR